MTDKNANTEIRKEFCPNCEAETPCTHEAELFVCDICGEDFAKYIVSRNCTLPDVSTTQDVLTSIKTSNSIENNNPDYYKQELARIAEFSQAVGLITTLKPTMVMDPEHPLDMAKEAAEYVTVRIAELESEIVSLSNKANAKLQDLKAELAELRERTRWIPVSERLPEEKQSVLALDRTGTAYHWEYSKCLSNIFVGYYTHWMPLPELPEEVK